MKRVRFIITAITLAAALSCTALFILPVFGRSADGVPAEDTSGSVAETPGTAGDTDGNTAEQDSLRMLHMLNMNYCYNSAFESEKSLIGCAAVSLKDFASYDGEYGMCVNARLVESFAESFYGVKIDAEAVCGYDAPDGCVRIEAEGCETFCHTPVSFTPTDYGYEAVTCLKMYTGGSDMTDCLVKSRFVRNEASEFGFNLIFCETL